VILSSGGIPPELGTLNDTLSYFCRMTRFNIWKIARYSPKGVYLKGDSFTLLPYGEMSDDELKWVWLFRRGDHKIELNDDVDDETKLTDFDQLTDFDLDDYKPEEATIDDLCGEMTKFLIKDNEEKKKEEREKIRKLKTIGRDHYTPLMSDVEIEIDLINVSTLMSILTEQNCPDDMKASLWYLIDDKKTELGYGEMWVKMTDVEKRLKTIVTTPVKKKMTDDERKEKLKKMTDEKEKRVLKMGLGDTKEKIGEVMRVLKESIDVDSTSTTTSIDEMEKVVCDGMDDVEMMVNYVAHIEVKLAHANNIGVRLVTLRGQIFALYLNLNPSATNVEIGNVFGVSSGIVSTSMSVARLVVEYPAFGHVTLPFTIIVRNMKRIRKWLDTASEEDKIFWGTD
jgi:hypothetical protein